MPAKGSAFGASAHGRRWDAVFSKVQPKELPTLLEAGTLNIPGLAGLAASVQWVKEKAEKATLGDYFYQELKKN